MDLTQWMASNGENDQSVADRIGVTRSYVYRVRFGQVHPSLGVGLALHHLTNGEVPLEMLLPRALRPAVTPLPGEQQNEPDKPRKRLEKSTSGSRAVA
jgi:transcriptional regulator with XRE-family HTH domain